MNKKIKYTFLLLDFLAAIACWVLFMLFRKVTNEAHVLHGIEIFVSNYEYPFYTFAFGIGCLFIYALLGFYLHPNDKTLFGILFSTLFSSIIISLIVFFTLILDDRVISYQYYYYSLLVLFSVLFLITLLVRFFVVTVVRHLYKTQKWYINTLVIGTGLKAQEIARELQMRSPRNRLIGYVAVNSDYIVSPGLILGEMDEIKKIIEEHQIKEAIIALDQPDEQTLYGVARKLFQFNVHISFTPRLYEILTGSAHISRFGINPLVDITKINMPDWQQSVKRMLDVTVSLVALVFLSPLFLFLIIKIKSDSSGPAFFLQERVGLWGKPFKIIKFRSMYVDAEHVGPMLSSPEDQRITPFGRVLRKYRIDELPQLVNVLKGEMSLVGPRPERKYFIEQLIEQAPYYCLLYKIRPGLTSWGPIKIGYADTIEKMIERLNYDIIYMDDMSLINDFKIIALTSEIIFKGKGV